MKIKWIVATLAAHVTFIDLAPAQILSEYTFSESSGTTLTQLTNSVAGRGAFTGDITGITTNGAGQLQVLSSGSAVQVYSEISSAAITGTPVQATVYVSSWDFTGLAGTGPAFQLGFTTIAGSSNSLIARAALFANANGFRLEGQGVNTSTQNIVPAPAVSFGLVRSEPLAFRITMDPTANTYAVSYDAGAGFVSIGSATTPSSPDRNPQFAVLRVSGDFSIGGTTSGMLIDRIEITAVPEPAAYGIGLAAFAGLLVAGRHFRRRTRHQSCVHPPF